MEYSSAPSEDYIITSLLHSPALNFRYKPVAKILSMASYRLLRNNKESGPYSLEALIQLGLKPYDLVWVEGRSAAWRYPSEVEDLKYYAPVVEEQPYDRFFKKPSEEKKEKQPIIQESIQTTVEPEPVKVQEIPRPQKAEKTEINTSKKQVYVSMPANGSTTVIIKKTEQPVAIVTSNGNAPVNELYGKKQEPETTTDSYSPSYTDLVNDYNKQQYAAKKAALQVKERPADSNPPLEKKYSQSLDDIKDMYAQNLVERKRKTAQRKMMMTVVKKVLPFAAVLIIGFLLGSLIMNKKPGNDLAQSQQARIPLQNNNTATDTKTGADNSQVQQQTESAQTAEELTQSQPTENNKTDLPATSLVANSKTTTEQKDALTSSAAKQAVKKENKITVPANNTANTTALSQPKNIEADPVTGERNKVVRSSETDNSSAPQSSAKQFSNSLMKQVSVSSNEYKRGTFGGIHDLQLTVNNNSNYLLDNVIVELKLLKPNDEVIKTDKIRFSPVPANGSLTLGIPATNRGVKVAYKITHVESKSAGNDTAGLK